MTHRGGIAADGKTGDGCGLLLAAPKSFLAEVGADAAGRPLDSLFAAGMLFYLRMKAWQEARATVERELTDRGCAIAGWRVVPTNNDSFLGPIALDQLPRFEQVFVEANGLDSQSFDTALFMGYRAATLKLAGDPDFYIASMSRKVISYKGLMMPADLPAFYPDLADERLASHIVVFHQRFSTNTLPVGRWRSLSVWSPTTARSTPFRATAPGPKRAKICSRRPICPRSKKFSRLVNTHGSTPQAWTTC